MCFYVCFLLDTAIYRDVAKLILNKLTKFSFAYVAYVCFHKLCVFVVCFFVFLVYTKKVFKKIQKDTKRYKEI